MSTVIHGFTVLPIQFGNNKKCQHCLYFKEHMVRDEDYTKPHNQTLFVINVPPYCGKAALKHVFTDSGAIQDIYIQATPSSKPPTHNKYIYFPEELPIEGFRVAYVIFKSPKAVQKATEKTFDTVIVPSKCMEPTGLKKWCQEYNSQNVNVQELESEIAKYMQYYDKEQAEKIEREKKEAEKIDEEGWTKVTRHGNFKAIPRTEEIDKQTKADVKRKSQKCETKDFYKFQVRESKMKHIVTLRKQFKQDQEKVARMKAARKFRPY